MKKVCIVIVNYNGYSLLSDTISSISGLDYTNYDIVVVDNNSTEPFPNEILERYPQVILLKQHENCGFAKGNNIGISYSVKEHYEYTLLLNNDVCVDSKLLSEMIGIADDNTIVVPKVCGWRRHRYYGTRVVQSCMVEWKAKISDMVKKTLDNMMK